MKIDAHCPKCGWETFQQLDDKGKWHTLDKVSGNSHWLTCHPEPPKFKLLDQVIMFWPKSCRSYVIGMIHEDKKEYGLTEHFTAEHKVISYNKLEANAKLMDKIYEYLYL